MGKTGDGFRTPELRSLPLADHHLGEGFSTPDSFRTSPILNHTQKIPQVRTSEPDVIVY
jgi:hypothetical protein